MRAHCINVYDGYGDHAGALWLSSPGSPHPNRRLMLSPDTSLQTIDGAFDIGAIEVRQLREACDAFLAEQETL